MAADVVLSMAAPPVIKAEPRSIGRRKKAHCTPNFRSNLLKTYDRSGHVGLVFVSTPTKLRIWPISCRI